MVARVSPIAQFRSKVQWYLDGNTPSFSSELVADLYIALRLLASDLDSSELRERQEIDSFLSFCQVLTSKSLKDLGGLVQVVGLLHSLLKVDGVNIADKRVFRDAVVQLILVAESHADLSFKKSVLELSKSIS